MAAFRGNAQGEILQLLNTRQLEKESPWNPAAQPYQVQFDELTNAGLIGAFNNFPQQFRIDGGTLTQNEVAVTINPPSGIYDLFIHAVEMNAKANSDQAHTWTTEEIDRLVGAFLSVHGLV